MTVALADWPVRAIPTGEELSVLAHPIVLIPRWLGHGDLHVTVDGLRVYVARADLLELLDVDADYEHPTHRAVAGLYMASQAIAIAHDAPTHLTADFLDWFSGALPELLNDDVLDASVGLEGFLDAYRVAQAARILDADPQVRIGQKTLFQHLAHIGWATRAADNTWQPTRDAIRPGWLTLRTVRLPGRHGLYEQIYVTKQGLAQLRVTLRALNPQPPTPAPQPALFED